MAKQAQLKVSQELFIIASTHDKVSCGFNISQVTDLRINILVGNSFIVVMAKQAQFKISQELFIIVSTHHNLVSYGFKISQITDLRINSWSATIV